MAGAGAELSLNPLAFSSHSVLADPQAHLLLPSSQLFLGGQHVHPSHQDQGHKVSPIYLYCYELMLLWPAL